MDEIHLQRTKTYKRGDQVVHFTFCNCNVKVNKQILNQEFRMKYLEFN